MSTNTATPHGIFASLPPDALTAHGCCLSGVYVHGACTCAACETDLVPAEEGATCEADGGDCGAPAETCDLNADGDGPDRPRFYCAACRPAEGR